ncbi:MAG TPA: DUF1499 domain-containing protein [Herpetosiphonaceae bacterium]
MNIVIDLFPWEQIFVGSALSLIVTALAGVGSLLRRRRIGPAHRILLALFALGAILPWLIIPRFGARLRRSMETNIAATSEDADWPELRPRRYDRPLSEVADAASRAFAQLGWRQVGQDTGALAAEVPILRGIFTDDFRVTLTNEGQQTVVNARSSARVGTGDLGANRRHVVQFFIVLDQQLNAAAPQR